MTVQDTIEIDQIEHDISRDEVMEALSLLDDEAIRAAHAHGAITAGIIVLSSIVSTKSLDDFILHMRETARACCAAIDGAAS